MSWFLFTSKRYRISDFEKGVSYNRKEYYINLLIICVTLRLVHDSTSHVLTPIKINVEKNLYIVP